MIDFYFTFYEIILLIVGGGSIGLALICLNRRGDRKALYLGLALIAEAWWTIFLALSTASNTLAYNILFSQISYFGIYSCAPFFLLFTLQYAGLEHWIRPRTVLLMWAAPLVVVGLASTNDLHHLIWTGFERVPDAGRNMYIFLRGPLYWLGVASNYIQLSILTVILFRKSFHSRFSVYRWQSLFVAFGILPTWIASVIYVVAVRQLNGMEITPVAFSITGVMIFIGIQRFHFLDLSPIAREILFERIRDGIVVLDDQKRIVDLNLAGEKFVSNGNAGILGQPASGGLVNYPYLLAALDFKHDTQLNTGFVPLKGEKETITDIEISISRLFHPTGRIQGYLIVFRDTSARLLAERMNQEKRMLADLLRETATALNSSLDSDQFFDIILTNASRMLPYDFANIVFFDDDGKMQLIRQRGDAGGTQEAEIKSQNLSWKNLFYLSQMVRTAQPVIVPNTSLDPHWVLTVNSAQCSYAGIPVVQKGTVMGVVNLTSRKAGSYTSAHLERLRIFTDQVAIAVTNAALLYDLRLANENLEASLAEVRSLQAELVKQASHDSLTGLFNRRYLEESLDRELSRARRSGQPVGIMMLDIDHFKKVNDTFGHLAGDEMLKSLANMLTAHTRAEDIICRFGGEEFVIVMPGISLPSVVERGNTLRGLFEDLRILYADRHMQATLSIGVAAFPESGEVGDELLNCADQALYVAKQNGRNRLEQYVPPPGTTPK